MKKIALITGVAMLAACAETAEAPVEEEAAATAEVVEEIAEEESLAGTYEVTWPDGAVSTTVIDADGNWSSTGEDGEPIGGTVAENEEGQACFTMEGDDEGPRCWTDSEVAEDGSWQATDDEGVTVTVREVEDA